MRKVDKCIDLIVKICGVLLIVAGLAMPILTFSNAVARKIGYSGLTWTDEVCRYCFIYMTYIGMVVCAVKGRHASVDLIFDHVHGRLKGFVQIIGDVLVVVFLGIVMYGSVQMLSTAGITTSPTLHIPLSYIYMSLVFGTVLTIFVYVWKIIDSVILMVTGKEREVEK